MGNQHFDKCTNCEHANGCPGNEGLGCPMTCNNCCKDANIYWNCDTNTSSLKSTKTTSYSRSFTPEFITSLKPNEIFVFGSNIRGMHGGGAARVAHMKFGAEWGVGEGITGQCYALPTMEGGVDYIAGKVQNFLTCATSHPELTFFVTKIACGIAGFTIEEIGPLFADAINMENVILPKEFVEEIEKL